MSRVTYSHHALRKRRFTRAARLLLAPLAVAGGGVAVASAALRGTVGDLSFWGTFGAMAALCGLLLCSALRADGGKSDTLSPAPVFAAVAFALFGLGAAYGWMGMDPLPEHPAPLPGLVMATAALGGFAIGYNVPVVRRARSLACRLPGWEPHRALLAGILCICVGGMSYAVYFSSTEYFFGTQSDISLDLASPLGYLNDFLWMGLAIVAIVSAKTSSKRKAKVIIWALSLVTLAALLPTGRRYYVFLMLASVGIPWHYYIRRVRLVTVPVVALLTILVLGPAGQLWRMEYHANRSTTLADVPAIVNAVGRDATLLNDSNYATTSFARFNQSAMLSALHESVPSILNYKYGQTYLPAVTWIVPRALWHDKPTFQFYNEVGRATGLLARDNYDAAVVYTLIGELYLNFGDFGVPIGMILLGMLCRWVYQALIANTRNETSVFVYSLIITPFWSMEVALGPSMGGAIRAIVSGMLVLWLTGALNRRRTIVTQPAGS